LKSADRFAIEGDFEAGVVYYLASSKGFFIRFARHLCGQSGKDGVDLFSSVYAQTLVEIMLTEYSQNDTVPGSVAIVGNMLTQRRNRGKIKESVRSACQAYLDMSILSAGDEDDMAAAFAVIVKDWLHWKATHLAIDLTAERKDISSIIEVLEDANSVLAPKVTGYTSARADDIKTWVELIKKSGDLNKLPTGITAWDHFLDGGLSRGTLGIIIAPTGAGKSLVLSQMAASALLRGIDTVYISLEIDDSQIAARTYAAVAGLPIDIVVKAADFIEPYLIRAFKRTNVVPGRFHLEEFPEGISVNEMFATLDKNLRKEDMNPQLYLIDYLDRFGGGRKSDKMSSYEHGREVTQAIRNYMHKNKKHGWSACQSKRFASKSEYKTADVDAAADSAHKARISDVVVNILFNKDGPGGVDEIASKISKHRSGKGAGKATAFRPVDYTYGIVFPSKDFDPIPYEVLKTDPNFKNLIDPDY
jgi:hypothetical protein